MNNTDFQHLNSCDLCDNLRNTATFVEGGFGLYICEECVSQHRASEYRLVKFENGMMVYLDD